MSGWLSHLLLAHWGSASWRCWPGRREACTAYRFLVVVLVLAVLLLSAPARAKTTLRGRTTDVEVRLVYLGDAARPADAEREPLGKEPAAVLSELLANGEPIAFEIERGGKRQTVTVKPAPR
jgi:hypothetical protein